MQVDGEEPRPRIGCAALQVNLACSRLLVEAGHISRQSRSSLTESEYEWILQKPADRKSLFPMKSVMKR